MEAGYDSLGSFSNTFKRHTGLSPKKYYQESTKAYDFMVKQLDEKGALLHQDPDCKSGNRLTVALSYPEGYEPRISCMNLVSAVLGFLKPAYQKKSRLSE